MIMEERLGRMDTSSLAAYTTAANKIDRECDKELELIDIMEKEGERRIEATFKAEEKSLLEDYTARLNDLAEGMYSEFEDKKRQVENEIASLDIASVGATSSNYYYPSKKTLRRRANEQVEAEKKPRKSSPQTIVHLLPEPSIAQDVKVICSQSARASAYPLLGGGSGGGSGSGSGGAAEDEGRRKVTIDSTRLNLGGKIFHRGQNVSVETANYGKFPATIQVMCESFVQLRSIIAGDTRQVTATKDDLECGRVIVKKRY